MGGTQLPETARTQRLYLRPFRLDDAASVFGYASDLDVTRYMEWPTHANVSESATFIRLAQQDSGTTVDRTWAVVLRSTSELIGAASCHPNGHRATFGYVLAKHVWGNGYATEAASAIVALLERNSSIARIWATCDVESSFCACVREGRSCSRRYTHPVV